MIISYEMFRKYIDDINLVPKLELIVCDEGHRLKNVDSTLTSKALIKCKATKRIVLTGTLIQNDLAELFSVVDFIAPGHLGSFSDFNRVFADPINRSRESSSSSDVFLQELGNTASDKLTSKLSSIMLRRTQTDILKKSLPCKTESLLLCFMTSSQCIEYKDTAKEIFDSVDRNIPTRILLEPPLIECIQDEDEGHECQESVLRNSSKVLPGLLKLRKICNYAHVEDDLQSDDCKLQALLASSTKLSVLDRFLSKLRIQCPKDKIVLVSNFTNMVSPFRLSFSFLSFFFAFPLVPSFFLLFSILA